MPGRNVACIIVTADDSLLASKRSIVDERHRAACPDFFFFFSPFFLSPSRFFLPFRLDAPARTRTCRTIDVGLMHADGKWTPPPSMKFHISRISFFARENEGRGGDIFSSRLFSAGFGFTVFFLRRKVRVPSRRETEFSHRLNEKRSKEGIRYFDISTTNYFWTRASSFILDET